MHSCGIGSSAIQATDLVQEILDISHELSTLKIKKLLDAIARRSPHSLLPHLVFNGNWHMHFEERFAFPIAYGFCDCPYAFVAGANLLDLAGYSADEDAYQNFCNWIDCRKWRKMLPRPMECFCRVLGPSCHVFVALIVLS